MGEYIRIPIELGRNTTDSGLSFNVLTALQGIHDRIATYPERFHLPLLSFVKGKLNRGKTVNQINDFIWDIGNGYQEFPIPYTNENSTV